MRKWPAWGANAGTGLALSTHGRRGPGALGPWGLLLLPPMLRPPIRGRILGAGGAFSVWDACGQVCGDSPKSWWLQRRAAAGVDVADGKQARPVRPSESTAGAEGCWLERCRPTGHSRKGWTAQVRERSAPTEKAVAATPEMRRCSPQRPAAASTPAANSTCHVRPSVKLNTCCGPARRIGAANAPTDIAAGAGRRRGGSPEPRVTGWPRRRPVLHQGFPGSCPFFPVCTCVLAQAVLPWPAVPSESELGPSWVCFWPCALHVPSTAPWAHSHRDSHSGCKTCFGQRGNSILD